MTLSPTASVPVIARRGGRTGFRLRGRVRDIALVLHVLSSVGWFGIAVAVAVAVVTAGLTGDHGLTHSLYRAVAASGWLSVPAGLVAALTGALMGLGTRYGLIRHWWVVVKTLVTIAVVVTDAFLVSVFANSAAATDHPAPPLFGATVAHVVVLVIATVLSVVKPKGLTPWGRRVLARQAAVRNAADAR